MANGEWRMANGDSDYAFDAHLADWHSEDSGLFYALGHFFFEYNRMETAVEELTMDLYEVPQAKQGAFRVSFLRQGSLSVAAERLTPILKLMDLFDTNTRFLSDLRTLAQERNRFAHGLVGSSEDTDDSPAFRLALRGKGSGSHASLDALHELLGACGALAQQLSTLRHDVAAGQNQRSDAPTES